ncbi:putative S-layer protein [Candidatus Pacearchaeota archaeon]|nr:putative S-layer protein [Candidatus Pacearchaeota archaeon]
MKRTLLSLFAFTVLAVLTLSLSSAALSLQLVGPSTLTNSTSLTSINVTNTGNGTVTGITFEVSGVQISPTTIASLSSNSSTLISVTKLSTDTRFGSQTATVKAKGTDTAANSTLIESNVLGLTTENTFCRSGPAGGNLTLDSIDISNEGEGDDQDWQPLDKITIEVRVRNTGDKDISDVDVKLGLFDSEGRNQVGDLDFSNTDEETISLGRINDGDRETATFEFTVPADISSGDYKLTVKAYSTKLGESNMCVDRAEDFDTNQIYDSISIDQESDEGKFIAFTDVSLNPNTATCGDSVDLSFDAVNVGDEDQDQTRVTAVNRELGVDLVREIRQDLDQGDRSNIRFTFNVPRSASDKTYNIELRADYDYNNGVYRESSDEATIVPLKVAGCATTGTGSGSGTNPVVISASLESDAKAGQPMTVKVTLTNRGTSSQTEIVNVKGYDAWASLDSISDRVVTLSAGESKDITLKFTVDNAASGDKTFTIDAQSGASTQSKDVVVSIAGAQGFSLGSLSGNPLIWVIGIINVVLIVLIIVVAVRLSQRS